METRENQILEAAKRAIVTKNGTLVERPALLIHFESVDALLSTQKILSDVLPQLNVKAGMRVAEQSGTYLFHQGLDMTHGRRARKIKR